MSTCVRCGCTKPCACDNYTPLERNTCVRCGCSKPCACDSYSHEDNGEKLPTHVRPLFSDEEDR
jgi:hypothetical protein